MENQSLELSRQTQIGNLPAKWQEKFLYKRIDEDPIQISLSERDAILRALNEGDRFIQVGKFTLMLNSMKSIDPLWGKENIPPCPEPVWEAISKDGRYYQDIVNKKEIAEWKKYFTK